MTLLNSFFVIMNLANSHLLICPTAPHQIWVVSGQADQNHLGHLQLKYSWGSSPVMLIEQVWSHAMQLLYSETHLEE